jgi:prepilin-type N-terminal cleavage/methylation domain-containing protein
MSIEHDLSVVRGPWSVANRRKSISFLQRTTDHGQRTAFTLVELLVVITIIGILVALITAAAMGAMRTARQAALKFEVDQIAAGFEKYKDNASTYPPNLMTDDTDFSATAEPNGAPIIEADVLTDLQRHFRQAFPKHRESDNLLKALVGMNPGVADYPRALANGMTAAEAVVFWLGGFGTDPLYPISGEGGPAYPIGAFGVASNNEPDPIRRKGIHDFDETRLGPRDDNNFFDSTNNRFIEYRAQVNGVSKILRINFWTFRLKNSTQPVIYFDVSRHPAAVVNGSNISGPYDPPAAFDLHVHALKTRSQSTSAATPIQFANQGKFQLLHTGIDDDWGADILEKSSVHDVGSLNAGDYLLFPTGPFTDASADTVVNFATPARIEDAQPQ